MTQPFIRNHQYNFIKKQADHVLRTHNTVSDPKVVEAVIFLAESKILEQFPELSKEQKELLQPITTCKTSQDFAEYLNRLSEYTIDFPAITEAQIKKLFPKTKKLKLPDLANMEISKLTYLGWIDIATNKIYFVYPENGKFIGVEGKFTPGNKKNLCSLCHGHEEVALVTAISKAKSSLSPDYYKAVGNYMCVDAEKCNKRITDVSQLEDFFQRVLV
ncbi:FusB/FusC family EF-G-binding protein [Brevibacillus panacihumi]|uniref:FusB/FusC family EF-G-binding protein n=1 Tax=Brevibacillus panacihumi TaxID=497735 RepID=UPI003D1E078A